MSIQLQLGGLSFYCATTGKYIYQKLIGSATPYLSITKELNVDNEYDRIEVLHNSLDYVMVPASLYDESMTKAYLQAKGVTINENSEIFVHSEEDIVYISMLDRGVIPTDFASIDVLPVIVKGVRYASMSSNKGIYSMIIDNNIHLIYFDGSGMLFCESFPIISDTDTLFFISAVEKRYGDSKKGNIYSLFEVGKHCLDRDDIDSGELVVLDESEFLKL